MVVNVSFNPTAFDSNGIVSPITNCSALRIDAALQTCAAVPKAIFIFVALIFLSNLAAYALFSRDKERFSMWIDGLLVFGGMMIISLTLLLFFSGKS
jgi:uncharacterized protein (DUF983 family)